MCTPSATQLDDAKTFWEGLHDLRPRGGLREPWLTVDLDLDPTPLDHRRRQVVDHVLFDGGPGRRDLKTRRTGEILVQIPAADQDPGVGEGQPPQGTRVSRRDERREGDRAGDGNGTL